MSVAPEITVRPNSVAVIGYHDGNAGQVETWLESVTGFHIACFVHPGSEPPKVDAFVENRRRVSQRTNFPTATSFKGRPLLTAEDWPARLLSLGVRRILPLLSNNRERLRAIQASRLHGLELISAVHPSAIILPGATISSGVWINAGAIVGYNAEVAEGVLINTGAQLDHHNIVEICCQIDPGVITAGNVTLRKCSHIHTGATIINRVEIGADAIVGAGAVVIASVPAECTVVGVPARIIKQHFPA